MPDGDARERLQEHVERQVRHLVAHEDLPPVDERLQRRWGLAFLALAVLLPLGFVSDGADVGTLWLALFPLVAFGILGLRDVMAASQGKGHRRWQRLRDAQAVDSDPSRSQPERPTD